MHGVNGDCFQKFTKVIAIELNKNKREREESIRKRPRRAVEGLKQILSSIDILCKSGEQKRIYLKKYNFRYEKRLEVESGEDFIKKVAEQCNDAEMRKLIENKENESFYFILSVTDIA